MRNNNGKTIKQLSAKSLKSNRMRNLFAVSAIILTCMLFTAVFSLVSGMMQVAQEQTMCEVGGRFHAGLKAVTKEQYEKNSLKKEFSGMIHGIAVIGISLSVVIAFIGILNFINAVITGILSRKRELAMLTSIGMTGEQMKKLLIYEGISYILIAGVISFVIGNILSREMLSALNGIIMCFEYQFTIMPFLIMMIVLLAVAVVTPLVAYKKMQKNSIVERLRVEE